MSIYTFQTSLLSAQKTGVPQLTNTTLSAVGVTFLSGSNVVVTSQNVGVVSLSTTDVGIAYTPVEFSVGSTVNTASSFSIANFPSVTVDVLGSQFNIPNSLHNKTLAIVKSGTQLYSTFTWLSSTVTVPLSDVTTGLTRNEVSSPEYRRMRVLGYY